MQRAACNRHGPPSWLWRLQCTTGCGCDCCAVLCRSGASGRADHDRVQAEPSDDHQRAALPRVRSVHLQGRSHLALSCLALSHLALLRSPVCSSTNPTRHRQGRSPRRHIRLRASLPSIAEEQSASASTLALSRSMRMQRPAAVTVELSCSFRRATRTDESPSLSYTVMRPRRQRAEPLLRIDHRGRPAAQMCSANELLAQSPHSLNNGSDEIAAYRRNGGRSASSLERPAGD